MRTISIALATLLAGSLAAFAHDVPAEIANSPPAGAFKAVSSLVKLPDFLPGMGQLFVDPARPPAGPFLAYDHDGKLGACWNRRWTFCPRRFAPSSSFAMSRG
ncbi:hypothetical protein [Mesorhizobium sp. YR577]|uniref:hypothetical protein n=1 Tax=Mesorhizobium sp. YR577 TaxID=1884373 RepID=UPI0008E27A89|nr:hypothetical protein SAMN05518861_12845 [Mesorhizobium sp. YR577]